MKIIFYIICIFISVSSYAQKYKKFRVGLALGGVSVNKAGGPSLSFEPAYRLNDRYTIGFKFEGFVVLGATNTPTQVGSQSINGLYYFTTDDARIFIGAGSGIYYMNDNGLIGGGELNYENKIGFYPRVGLDYKHLTAMIEYNLMTPVKVVTKGDLVSPPTISFFNINYLSVKLGVSVGGGKKK